ncbi:MAG: ORF6C domain-containing protein [Niameybacter sp.]
MPNYEESIKKEIINELELKAENGQVVVSSRVVADRFERRHSDVLASIENITTENSVLIDNYFIPSIYKAGTGKNYPEYLLTKDGFTLLAMGFTGTKALEWKLKYIEAFNKMEDALKNKPMSLEEIMIFQLEEQKKLKQQVNQVNSHVLETKHRVDELEDNMPLFNCECRELQAIVKKVGIVTLGGYKSKAYNDNSLRGKIYSDIHRQIKREFGVSMYQSIKRSQFEDAKGIVGEYKAPLVLTEEIKGINNQISFYN